MIGRLAFSGLRAAGSIASPVARTAMVFQGVPFAAEGSRRVAGVRSVSCSARLDGKVAIVTASTAGIGLAIAKRLGEEGAKVMISSRKQENVDKTVQELRDLKLDVHGVVCHVAKDDHRKKLIEETQAKFGGKIDILISNAAANPAYGPLIDTTGDQWDKIMDTNVKASFMLSKDIVPIMQKQGGGSITFITSIAAFSPLPGLGAYSISKTALLGLSNALAAEHSRDGIRVNAIAPGIVKTHFSQALWEDAKQEQRIIKQVPLGRVGLVEDIAGVAAFLSSDDAAYVTGETLPVTGGMHTSRL